MSCVQKVMTLLLPMKKCPVAIYQRVVFTAQFDNSSPSVTRDKENCQVIWLWGNDVTTSETEYSIGTFWMRFTCCPNFNVSRFSRSGDKDFQTGHFADFEQFILLTLGYSKLTLIVHLYWLWAGCSYFTEFKQDVRTWKTIQILSIWQKIQESHIGSGPSHFQCFNQQESRTGFPS